MGQLHVVDRGSTGPAESWFTAFGYLGGYRFDIRKSRLSLCLSNHKEL